MSLCVFVKSVHLCSSVRERTPSVTFLRSSVTLSQPPPTMSHPSVTHQTCSSVTLSSISSNLFTRLLVHLSTCHVTLSQTYPVPVSALYYSPNLFICYLVFFHTQLVNQSTRQLVNLPRYPVSYHKQLVNPSTRQLVNLHHYPIPR